MPQALPILVYAVMTVAEFTALQIALAVTATSLTVGALEQKKARRAAQSARKDLQVVLQTAVEPHRTVYGRAKISGVLAYAHSSGTDNNDLKRVVALTGHEINAYEQIYFNDDALTFVASGAPVTDPDLDITGGYFAGTVKTARYVDGSSPGAAVEGFIGTSAQTASGWLTASTGGQWTADHRLRGRAYLVVGTYFNQKIFTEGVPNVQALVRGKKLYDPRTALTAWSRNPALAIRDYLTSVLQVPSARIDDDSFIAAANLCDEYVTVDTTAQADPASWAAYMTAAVGQGTWELVSGTTYRQRRYTCDGVITADATPGEALEQLVYSCAGYLSYTGGVWRLVGGSYTAPTLTLTESDLRDAPQFQPHPARKDLANVVRGSYAGPASNYNATDFPPLKATAFIAADGGIEMPMDLDLPFTNEPVACGRLSQIQLYRSRQGVLQFPATLTGLALRPGDTVAVTLPRFGFSAEVFRVEGWTLADDLGVDLVLREESSSVYVWTPDDAMRDPSPQLNLPNPWIVPPITGLAATSNVATALINNDGTIVPRTLVTWDLTTNAFANKVEIETMRVGASVWTPHPPARDEDGSAYILSLQTNAAYSIRARRVNAIGAASVWTTIAHTPQSVNVGDNLLRNSNWEQDLGYTVNTWYPDSRALRWWGSGYSTTTPNYMRNYGGGTAWNIGAGGMCMYDPSNIDGKYMNVYQDVPVAAGVEFEASAYVAAHRCQAWIAVEFLNAAKSVVLGSTSDFYNAGTNADGYPYAPLSNPRVWCKSTAPATSAYARVSLWMQKTAGTSPYPFTAYSNALLCVAPDGVTRETATPWTPDGITTLRGLTDPVTVSAAGTAGWDTTAGPTHTITGFGAVTSVDIQLTAGTKILIDVDYQGQPGVAISPCYSRIGSDVVVSGSGKTRFHTDATDRTGNFEYNESVWSCMSSADSFNNSLQRTYTAPSDEVITVWAGGGARIGSILSGVATVRLRVTQVKA